AMSAARSSCRRWCGQRCEDSQSATQQLQQQQQQRLAFTQQQLFERRLRICQEIAATERRYCCCLRIIIDLLAQTVKASACLHSAFLSELERRLPGAQAAGPDSFSSVVLHFLDANGAELLCLYRDYANDYRCALATLRKCLGRSGRLRRLLRCLQRHPSCQGLDLPAYLLTPVQRTPRYLLLLAQLRASTPDDHPDLPALHFLGGGQQQQQQHRDTQPELQASSAAVAAAAATGRMGPRSLAISRQLRAADRCHSAGDILRQQQQQQTLRTGVDKPTSPIQPAPLATWEEPPLRPPFSGARRRAKSTSSRPTAAIKESLRR
uniref:DH domain-containing protein n=1 Tax=Macrostomum lignano TaxID=282301 RepID=A0A1I8I820_9PLAT